VKREPALFLSPASNAHGEGRLNPRVINTVFNELCSLAGVEGHTPHDARHAMGRHLIEKTGNIAALQRQLGHTNAAYSIQYARFTDQELQLIEYSACCPGPVVGFPCFFL
jgi:site-specific recombinase XerC